MKLRCYSIYDTKALVYNAPFFMQTDGAAFRAFSDLVNDPQTNISRHPGDYILYCIGDYDDQTGFLCHLSPLLHIVDGNALRTLPINNTDKE